MFIWPAVIAALVAAQPMAADISDPVPLLQQMIRMRTVNPPGNESVLTMPLAAVFQAAGMSTELTGTTQDRLNLIVTVPGRQAGEKPWLFLAHVDTVTANPTEWNVDPFSARVSDGAVWGRGAIDDKGMAATLATALLRLQSAGKKPRHPITVIFAVDEETGSKAGIEWLLEKRPALFDVAGVVNEGGFTILDPQGPAKKTYYLSVGEKGVAWMRLRARGMPGHGSIRWGDNANETLLAALQKIVAWPHPQSAAGPMAEFAARDMARQGKPARTPLEALRKHPLGKQAERDPQLRSVLSDTCNVTVLKAGEKPNVIPGSAEAVVDCRVVPGQTPEAFLNQARKRINDDRVEIELLTRSTPNVSLWQTPLFAAFEATAKSIDPASLVVPVLAAGATDSRFWRERGVPAYGIVPIPITPEMVKGMHGRNERVPVDGLREGAEFLTRLLTRLGGYESP